MKKCISVILTIFMVFSLIMIPINIVYGQADVRAPELKSIRIDKKEVIAGDKVTFTAEITDDISISRSTSTWNKKYMVKRERKRYI